VSLESILKAENIVHPHIYAPIGQLMAIVKFRGTHIFIVYALVTDNRSTVSVLDTLPATALALILTINDPYDDETDPKRPPRRLT